MLCTTAALLREERLPVRSEGSTEGDMYASVLSWTRRDMWRVGIEAEGSGGEVTSGRIPEGS